jgi:hypothetical protein
MATLPKQPITMPKAAKPVPAPNSDFYELAETLYSYEGTYQMQNLIVGKSITGFSAFV